MLYTKLTKRAISLCFKAHESQLDPNGLPFVTHPLCVAEQMKDEASACVALLHDSLAVGAFTADQLTDDGFPKDIVDAIVALTREEKESDEDYLYRIKQNHIAKIVKEAELIHETNMGRLNEITQRDIERIKHCRLLLQALSAAEDERGYFVCTVVFAQMPKKLYYYRADDTDIHAGDEVIVPVGEDGKTTAGTVLYADFYTYPTLPIPLSRMKFVVRKFDRDAMQTCPISGRLIDKMTCYQLSDSHHGNDEIKSICRKCEHYHK